MKKVSKLIVVIFFAVCLFILVFCFESNNLKQKSFYNKLIVLFSIGDTRTQLIQKCKHCFFIVFFIDHIF